MIARIGAMVACVFLLGSCSSAESAGEPAGAESAPASTASASEATPEPSDDAELKAAVQAYSDAFLTGDSDAAFALLSERCQERTGEGAFEAIVDAAGDQYGSALEFTSFAAEISGDLARVTYTFPVAEINQDREPWVREAGAWHEDDC